MSGLKGAQDEANGAWSKMHSDRGECAVPLAPLPPTATAYYPFCLLPLLPITPYCLLPLIAYYPLLPITPYCPLPLIAYYPILPITP